MSPGAKSDDRVDLAGKVPVRSKDPKSSSNEMDARLEMCFLYAIKFSVKESDLPLLASTFYQNHMKRCCPVGEHLKIKQSSYKTVSKFLKKQEKAGLVDVKMRSKRGGERIVFVNELHDLLSDTHACSNIHQTDATKKKQAPIVPTNRPACTTKEIFERPKPGLVIQKKDDKCPIKIDILERAPFKQTTVIDNLDDFGIELKEFCDNVHKKLCCGAFVSTPHTDPALDEIRAKVVVQGNQIESVRDLLINEYGVPRKLITRIIHDEYEVVPKVISKEKIALDKKNQYKRKNALCITGISEQEPDGDVKELILGLARALKVDMCKTDIDSCYRVRKPKPGRERKIVVEFASMSARHDLFMKRRRLRNKKMWNGIYINENLTPYREKLFYHARRFARAKLIKSADTQDGNVYVIDNSGKKHMIIASEQLTVFGVPNPPEPKLKQL